jgi:hypothetical protein
MADSAHLIRVRDNFYSDPSYIREEALAARYSDHSTDDLTAFGSSSLLAFLPCDIGERICQAFGFDRIELLPSDTGTGCFYCTPAEGKFKEEFRVHRDSEKYLNHPEYALLVYLAPNAPHASGTGVYRHKKTGLWKEVTASDAANLGRSVDTLEDVLDGCDQDKSQWDLIGFADNLYNRAVIYPAHWLHSGNGYFGNSVENGRIYHMFFLRGWPDIFMNMEEEIDLQFRSGKGKTFPHR